MRTSYAQNFEDIMLLRAFAHIENGCYVDVGAQDPVQDSVSLAFYQRGWRGVHIEPVPEYARRLRQARPDERVIQAAIGAQSQPIPFYCVADTGMSTGDLEIAQQHEKAGIALSTLEVECLPLSAVLDSLADRPVHWLKIDVEGMEKAVLESWAPSPVRPWILVIESTKPNSTQTTHHAWEFIVLGLGYDFAYFDGLNRFYVSQDHPELKSAFDLPPNYFDDFSVTETSVFARLPLIRVREIEAERDAARQRGEALSEQLHATNARVQDLTGRIDKLGAAMKDLGERQDRAARDAAVLNMENDQLKAALTTTQQTSQTNHDKWLAAERAIVKIQTSTSWKLTAPLRHATRLARYAARGFVSWITLRPGSRPRRLVHGLLEHVRRQPAPTPAVDLIDAAIASGVPRYVFVGHTVSCATNTGVQRVVRGLCRAYLEAGLPVRFVKWDDHANACVLIDSDERAYLGRWNGPRPSPAEDGVYPAKGRPQKPLAIRQGEGGRLIVPEVTHMSRHSPITSRLIAWARANRLYTAFIFYDAIPLQREEFSGMAPAHAQYMRDLRMADAVWPISRWSADDLASFWGASADIDNSYLPKIHPIHLPAEFDRVRTTEINDGEQMILAVGTVEPRKNQVALIRAFQSILAQRIDCKWRLVLAGNLHPAVAEEIKAATGPSAAIEYLGHVSDDKLSELYDQCAFTAFASVSEGFGLPILESLWHAKPCLCANFGAMAEVASAGGCLTIDVREEALLQAGLERLMDDGALRRSLAGEAAAAPMKTWADYLKEAEAAGSSNPTLIYYWVNSTLSFPANTGIQRVSRQLARALIDAGYALVPVKWGGKGLPFRPVSPKELAHFALWNGPAVETWHAWVAPECHNNSGWFLMTELPLDLTEAEQQVVREAAEAASLRTAIVFYDTIPWKMRDIYPKSFSEKHRSYILETSNYDVVLPISQYTHNEIVGVLSEEFDLPASRLGHLRACALPGEFPEKPDLTPTAASRPAGVIEVLCIGTVEPRKNHQLLLDAFERACALSTVPLRLTIVGSGHSIQPELAVRVRERVALSPNIEWEEKADDARIKELYARCDFTVYPSIEEGFGLPILESLWEGKPCICANFGAMHEVAAEGGGCVTVDVTDAEALAAAICDLANAPDRLRALADEAKSRTFRSWRDYAGDVANRLGLWTYPQPDVMSERREAMGLGARPRLSVCISTYNRAEWLATALRNLTRLYPHPLPEVEFVICDNASTDHTPNVVRPYLAREDVTYRRNRQNVGMLGNLRETAQASRGDYIWILGDDDLVRPGAIERVLKTIKTNPGVALVYLNYAFTRIDDARSVTDFDRFFAEATPIVPPEGDMVGPIRTICARNENFFTAIYTLVFRRDHGLKAYSQDTSGRPFSTMLTCIPTTYYVLNHMMEEQGVWIGEPIVVVNMNVSWMRYAPLWILERIPEVYEVARQKGVSAADIDRWRRHTLPSVEQFFREIFTQDPLNNAAYLNVGQLLQRFSDLEEFQSYRASLLNIYTQAHERGHPAAAGDPSLVFGSSAKMAVTPHVATTSHGGGFG